MFYFDLNIHINLLPLGPQAVVTDAEICFCRNICFTIVLSKSTVLEKAKNSTIDTKL